MKPSAVAILENPRAGKGHAGALSGWLLQELSKRSIPARAYRDPWPENFDAYSDIWLIGGDGTINYFINRYPGCDKALALFKAGTGNDFAWKLYGNKNHAAQLEQVLEARTRQVDAGSCNGQLFINCLGLGFDGEVIRSMRSIRLLGGHIGYLLAVMKKIFGFREHRFSIQCSEGRWQQEFLLAMIVNSSRAGGGFFVAPDASIEDGKLDMVLAGKLSLLKRLRYLPVIKRGQHMHLPFIIHKQVSSCQISCDVEMAIQADGELLHAQHLNIEILPGKFSFRY